MGEKYFPNRFTPFNIKRKSCGWSLKLSPTLSRCVFRYLQIRRPNAKVELDFRRDIRQLNFLFSVAINVTAQACRMHYAYQLSSELFHSDSVTNYKFSLFLFNFSLSFYSGLKIFAFYVFKCFKGHLFPSPTQIFFFLRF